MFCDTTVFGDVLRPALRMTTVSKVLTGPHQTSKSKGVGVHVPAVISTLGAFAAPSPSPEATEQGRKTFASRAKIRDGARTTLKVTTLTEDSHRTPSNLDVWMSTCQISR